MRHRRILALALGLAALARVSRANTYTVTSTADSGAGTLRQAILDANANPGADAIAFNITGSGPHTIAPTSALPGITDAVTIDGYTQAGSSANTNPTDQGLNTVLQIVLDGNASAGAGPGLNATVDGVTIKGLVIHRWHVAAVRLGGPNGVVTGNYLGTIPDGSDLPDTNGSGQLASGVLIAGANARVGGTAPADRNLISGFNFSAVAVGGASATIQGNLIAMKASGQEPLPDLGSSSAGVSCANATGLVIGGPTDAARNVFGNPVQGIWLNTGCAASIQGNFFGIDTGAQHAIFQGQFVGHGDLAIEVTTAGAVDILDNVIGAVYLGIAVGTGAPVIQGNFIGTDRTGTLDFGTQARGIEVDNAQATIIGGVAVGDGNTIAFNGHTGSPAAGITVVAGTATIRGNSIHDNRPPGFPQTPPSDGLGIDLKPGSSGGVTPNDAGDGDSGPNGLQNFPIITSAVLAMPQGNGTRVQGTLDSTPSTSFDVDFYRGCNRRPQVLPEGETYMESRVVTTDASGHAAFDFVLADNISAGDTVTATATDPSGNTSEFSQSLVHSSNAVSGAAAGGTSITFRGMLLESGATLTIGGAPATNVDVTNETTMTATMPALPAGSVNDAVVSNPSGSSGTLVNAWVADFLDVPPGNLFHSSVIRLVRSKITAGVGGGSYGINASTLRQQMAVFLLKGKHGVCYTPPPCAGAFPDVPCPSGFANWIEALAAEGITGGCGGGNYCPGNPVLRQQMAVFLLKAKHGSTYVPPPCTGVFPDVPCPSPFADWIEQLAAEGITGGCGAGNFCPGNPVTRGQMAAFLSGTFFLPL